MALQVICKKPQAKTKSHVRRSHDSTNYPHDTGKKEPNTAASTDSKDTKDVEGDIYTHVDECGLTCGGRQAHLFQSVKEKKRKERATWKRKGAHQKI